MALDSGMKLVLLIASVAQRLAQQYPPLELVTVTTDANKAQRLLQTSPLPVRILGPIGHNVSTFGYLKDFHFLLYVRELLRQGRNNTVVIMLDSWDMAYMGCDRDILKTFKAFERPLFFSAEMAFYPWGAGGMEKWRHVMNKPYPYWGAGPGFWALPRCSAARNPNKPCRSAHRKRSAAARGTCSYCVPMDKGGGNRFLNIGCWGGYAWAVERALSELYDEGHFGKYSQTLERTYWYRKKNELGDQIMWTLYALSHRHEIALDYGASICTSLHGLCPKRDLVPRKAQKSGRRQDGRSHRIYAVPYKKDICFAHANGGHEDVLDELLKATGPTPWSQRFGPSAAARLRYGRPLTAASEATLSAWG